MSAAFFLGALTDWPMFYLVPLLTLHQIWINPRPLVRRIRQVLPLVAAAALVLVVLVLWSEWAAPGFSFLDNLASRTFGETDDHQPITLEAWIRWVFLHHYGWLHGWAMLALAGVGLVALIVRPSSDGMSRRATTFTAPGLVLAWGGVHLVIGMQGNFQHEFWNIVVTPGLAMAAGWGAEVLFRLIPRSLSHHRTAAAGAAGVMGLLYLGCSARTAYEYWSAEYAPNRGYSLKDLGCVIRGVSAEDDGILTSYSESIEYPNWHAAAFWYADRQMRVSIFSVAAFERVLGAGPYDLQFGLTQPHGPAPKWFVLPPPHRSQLPELTQYLDARYPRTMIRGYSVYRLAG